MARRYYSSTAAATTLAAGIDNSATSITVAAATGFPSSLPWTAVIDYDTVDEEIVEVTARSGTSLTVTRGVDGTSGKAHGSGAKFRHGVSARDFDEANAFVNGGGIAGSLVDAKGDLIAASADNTPDRLAVGSDGQILYADSGETTGLRWGAPPAGGGLEPFLLMGA